MKNEWDRLEGWLSGHWPEGLYDLNPPATDAEISALETALGVRLPADFIACLKIHNGQKALAGGLFDGAEFLSTAAILTQWEIWKGLLDEGDFDSILSNPELGIKNDWWNARWIPFTHNGGGDHYCLDLDPDDRGFCGQIITMWHDMGDRNIQGKSFQRWFQRYVDAVLNGQYAYSEEDGGLFRIGNVGLSN